MSEDSKNVNDVKVPFPKNNEANVMGDIKINHSVIANIVRLATQQVEGVHSVGGGFVEGIAEIFSKKDSERGVRVSENEVGEYVIEVKVNLLFGYELAKVGAAIQKNVSENILRMTMKPVDRVDVIIDGVKTPTVKDSDKDRIIEE
jgi:uncharacterized alkaline shock family protein YloU